MNNLGLRVSVCAVLTGVSLLAGRALASESATFAPGVDSQHASLAPFASAPDDATQPASGAAASSSDVAIPSHPALTSRLWFAAGAFLASSTTEARLDSELGVGTTLDLEDVLGLDETTTAPQVLARWRISNRWRLELEYFEVDRTHTRAATQDIVWGDVTFPVGTELRTEFNVGVTRVSGGYSFFKREDKEVGVALGFHVTDYDARLSTSGGSDEDGAVLAPLPVISLYGQFALTDHWAVDARLDAFRLEYDPYEGRIFSMGVDVLCQPWKHFGFGLGWRSLQISVEADHDDWDGRVSSNFQGPIAFASVSF